MLPSPRIVVIDDELEDMRAIVEGLNTLGAAAVGIHYTSDKQLSPFPCLRILFLDLHLHSGAGDTDLQITYTVGLLSQLISTNHGPYAIVLWSLHDDERDRFEAKLKERIPYLEIPAPHAIMALKKADHLELHDNRKVKDVAALGAEVLSRIHEDAHVAALLAWEEHVTLAANDTICQISQMVREETAKPTASLNDILGELAIAAAGHENAKKSVFRATNEVLVGIVSDRLLHRTVGGELDEQWKKAVTLRTSKESDLTIPSAARLNSLLHLETGDFEPFRRGRVVDLSSLTERQFIGIWGESRQTMIKHFDRQNKGLKPTNWLMAQVRASCDEAQQNSGLLPFVLGISLVPSDKDKIGDAWVKDAGRCDFLWLSPPLATDEDKIMYLALHLRFIVGLSEGRVTRLRLKSKWRLRESILAEISKKLHSYGDRPGIIRFTSTKK